MTIIEERGERSFFREFAATQGAKVVHASWRDHMLEQGREVSSERMQFDTLSDQDRELDYHIAFDVLKAYYDWIASKRELGWAEIMAGRIPWQ